MREIHALALDNTTQATRRRLICPIHIRMADHGSRRRCAVVRHVYGCVGVADQQRRSKVMTDEWPGIKGDLPDLAPRPLPDSLKLQKALAFVSQLAHEFEA